MDTLGRRLGSFICLDSDIESLRNQLHSVKWPIQFNKRFFFKEWLPLFGRIDQPARVYIVEALKIKQKYQKDQSLEL